MAALIENPPFRWISFKARAISRKIFQAELAHPLLQALAHLAPHLAEARPMQLEPRQCPLQEGCAIGIVHDIPSRLLPDCGGQRANIDPFIERNQRSLAIARNNFSANAKWFS